MAGRSGQSAEEGALRRFRARATRITASAALGLLVFFCCQWSADAVATASAVATRGPGRADTAGLAVAGAEKAWLAARSERLAQLRRWSGVAASQAEALVLSEFGRVEQVALSAETQAIAASLRLALERWSNESELPEAYSAFAAAMEAVRAEEIARHFRLLAESLAAETAAEADYATPALASLQRATRLWAVGGPAAAIVLLLIVFSAERASNAGAPARAGVIVLDADANVVYADADASKRFARYAQHPDEALRALDAVVIEFRNEGRTGECLIAGLETGDTVRAADGRKLKVRRRAAENGVAVLTMSETRRGAPA